MKNKLNRNRSTINWWWTYRMRCPYGWNIVLGEDCLHSRICHGHLSRDWKHWNQIKNVKSSNAYRQIQSGVLHINITVHFFYFMHTHTSSFLSRFTRYEWHKEWNSLSILIYTPWKSYEHEHKCINSNRTIRICSWHISKEYKKEREKKKLNWKPIIYLDSFWNSKSSSRQKAIT